MKFFYLYATVVILSPLVVQAAQNRFMPEIQNVSCPTFSNHVMHYECAYQKVSNGKYLINNKFMFDRKFGKDMDMHVLLRVTPWNGKTSFNFIDMRVNFCAAFSQAFSNLLMQKLFNEFIRTTNMPLNCLFKANVMYKVENYTLTDELLPAYAPLLNATFSMSFFQINQPVMDYTMYVALIPKE